MRPRRYIVNSFEKQRDESLEGKSRKQLEDKEGAKQEEAELQVRQVCETARLLSEQHAKFISPGTQVLGRDAMLREYESKWVIIDHDDDLSADIEARLTRQHRIFRDSGIEKGSPYLRTTISLRLNDPEYNIKSPEDINVVSFEKDEIKIFEDVLSSARTILPGSGEDWVEVKSLLEKIKAAFSETEATSQAAV